MAAGLSGSNFTMKGLPLQHQGLPVVPQAVFRTMSYTAKRTTTLLGYSHAS